MIIMMLAFVKCVSEDIIVLVVVSQLLEIEMSKYYCLHFTHKEMKSTELFRAKLRVNAKNCILGYWACLNVISLFKAGINKNTENLEGSPRPGLLRFHYASESPGKLLKSTQTCRLSWSGLSPRHGHCV